MTRTFLKCDYNCETNNEINNTCFRATNNVIGLSNYVFMCKVLSNINT